MQSTTLRIKISNDNKSELNFIEALRFVGIGSIQYRTKEYFEFIIHPSSLKNIAYYVDKYCSGEPSIYAQYLTSNNFDDHAAAKNILEKLSEMVGA